MGVLSGKWWRCRGGAPYSPPPHTPFECRLASQASFSRVWLSNTCFDRFERRTDPPILESLPCNTFRSFIALAHIRILTLATFSWSHRWIIQILMKLRNHRFIRSKKEAESVGKIYQEIIFLKSTNESHAVSNGILSEVVQTSSHEARHPLRCVSLSWYYP